MMRMRGRAAWRGGLVLIGAVLLGAPGPAGALQLSLVGDERINFLGGSLTGTPYATSTAGVDYDEIGGGGAHPGEFLVTGTIPTLNYHTTGDTGTNVAFNFGPDLTFTLEAELTSITITPAFLTFVTVTYEFKSTADGSPDLIVTDPSDSTVVLEADLIAGNFLGNDVAALTAKGTFNSAAIPQNLNVSFNGFFKIDNSSLYASLFADSVDGVIGFESGTISDWEIGDADGNFDFDNIAGALTPGGLGSKNIDSLISHAAEANGSIFALEPIDFTPVPEPGTLLLVGSGLVVFGSSRRRRSISSG